MIAGKQFIGYSRAAAGTKTFRAINPAIMENLPENFFIATTEEIEQAMQLAATAFQSYKTWEGKRKSAFLNSIADNLQAIMPQLVERIGAEAGLPEGRVQGETGRTINQLRLYAGMCEEGSWIEARIDTAQLDRLPAPKPDMRKMMVPIGPVVVFGASNFPMAYSVAGGDTASALASGCPVVVKAHPAHPGTSELVADAIIRAAQQHGAPEGVFSMLFDNGFELGTALVKHPLTKAVGFTGSFNGGMALHRMALERAEPIPVFAEMGSVNPVVVFPEALQQRGEQIAAMYAGSVTLGAGQFCTNPGLMFVVDAPALPAFEQAYAKGVAATNATTMLTPGIFQTYQKLKAEATAQPGVEMLATSVNINAVLKNQAQPLILKVSGTNFINNPKLHHEVFGPFSILIVCKTIEELQEAVNKLEGQLTLSLMIQKEEATDYKDLITLITDKAGRIVMNGVPTGVEVCAAMQHGGPFPASTDGRFTSVGHDAIKRWVRPLAFQSWEDELLPNELKESNPLNIWRFYNNEWTK